MLNSWTFTQIHTRTMEPGAGGREGWVGGNRHRVFDMLQYFETTLPSVKSL